MSKPNQIRATSPNQGNTDTFDYIKTKNLFYNESHEIQSEKTSHYPREDIYCSYNQYN